MTNGVNELDLAGAPEIILGGRAFKVLPIVARQNRIITPRVMSMLPLFIQAATAAQAAQTAGLGAFAMDVTEEQFDKLIDIAHAAIWRAHPDVKRDDLLDMPIKFMELFMMLEVVAKQAGLSPEKVQTGGAGPLAAPAATAEQTGTQSLPKSPSEQDGQSTTSSTP